MRNKVYAIVEGHSEAGQPAGRDSAALVLIARLLQHQGCHTLYATGRPAWRLTGAGAFAQGDNLERAIRAHRVFEDCGAVVVLLDVEDACAKDVGPQLTKRVAVLGALPFSVTVVCASREFETWFLHSLDTIRLGQSYPGDPDARRDAKGWLRQQFGYRQTRDQTEYVRSLDIDAVSLRSRSFRRMVHAIQEIESAFEAQTSICTPRV